MKKLNKKGFTLTELIVVIAVIAILAAVLIPTLTGYIEKAGRCLASTASFNESDYLLVTLNAYSTDMGVHVKDALTVYNYYKDNYSYHDYLSEEDVMIKLNTESSKENEVIVKAGINKRIYYDNSFDKEKVEYVYNGEKIVSPFTKKGSKLGEVIVKYNGEDIDKFDLTYNDELTFSLKNYLQENIIAIVLCLFIFIRINTNFKICFCSFASIHV